MKIFDSLLKKLNINRTEVINENKITTTDLEGDHTFYVGQKVGEFWEIIEFRKRDYQWLVYCKSDTGEYATFDFRAVKEFIK